MPRPARIEAGSSPLTRGKLVTGYTDMGSGRLIPAHAGKTTRLTARPPAPSAHPRSRGENRTGSACVSDGQGSSPLTRGKRRVVGAGLRGPRLIPAHAGKTFRALKRNTSHGAHPRSRGENRHGLDTRRRQAGSSPLTRGKRKTITGEDADFGLIPAHAGKTPPRRSAKRLTQAHPRSRGENTS